MTRLMNPYLPGKRMSTMITEEMSQELPERGRGGEGGWAIMEKPTRVISKDFVIVGEMQKGEILKDENRTTNDRPSSVRDR